MHALDFSWMLCVDAPLFKQMFRLERGDAERLASALGLRGYLYTSVGVNYDALGGLLLVL